MTPNDAKAALQMLRRAQLSVDEIPVVTSVLRALEEVAAGRVQMIDMSRFDPPPAPSPEGQLPFDRKDAAAAMANGAAAPEKKDAMP